jgi:hypothetical protein
MTERVRTIASKQSTKQSRMIDATSKHAARTASAWIAGGVLWGAGAALDAASGWRFAAAETVWLAADAALLVGLIGLRRLHPHGTSKSGSRGLSIAVAGRVVFILAELLCVVTGTNENALLPLGALTTTVGMLAFGAAVARAGVWTGVARFAPLAMGVYPLACMFPFVALTGEPNVAAIGIWGAFAALVGLATLVPLQASREPHGARDAGDDVTTYKGARLT